MKKIILLIFLCVNMAFSVEVLLEKMSISRTYLTITYLCINDYTYIVIGEYNKGNTMSPMIKNDNGEHSEYISCERFKISEEYKKYKR